MKKGFRKKLIAFLTASAMAAMTLLSGAGTVGVLAAETEVSQDSMVAALITGDQVTVTGIVATASEDGIVHLYAQQPYESGVQGTEVAQAAYTGSVVEWTFALGYNTADSNLTKKFQAAVMQNGVLTAVGNAVYISNPEAIATHTSVRMITGKKGLLPDSATILNTDYLSDLGVQQSTYNLTLGRIVSCNGVLGTIEYVYNGKTYYFDYQYVSEYDYFVSGLNEKGIQVSLVVLNDLGTNTTLIHPMATIPNTTGTTENYYALNAATQSGVELLEAVMTFLAERFSGTEGHGQVDNWIIGNEVNAYTQWNYMSSPSLEYYTQEYANAFRVCYNSIKSQNANANVYVATDQQWAVSSNEAIYYGGKPFLEEFNSVVETEGDIDWGVATHPYNVPLYDPYSWVDNSLATHSQDSRYITMNNIDVLTDFLCQEEYLSPSGEVRSVLLSEVGYTSSQGEELQAASITFAYLQAISNQYIDGLIISRQLDTVGEIGQGLAVGLQNLDYSPKTAYNYYKNLGDMNYVAAASAFAGVDLTTLVTPR